jgi:hypothetical protein
MKHDYHFKDGYVSGDYQKAADRTQRKLVRASKSAKVDNESRMLSSMEDARSQDSQVSIT